MELLAEEPEFADCAFNCRACWTCVLLELVEFMELVVEEPVELEDPAARDCLDFWFACFASSKSF